MLSNSRQILVAAVAVVVLVLLWFVGNDTGEIVPTNTTTDTAAASTPAEPPASLPRGIPRNGVLDPISIDPNRPADLLPQYPADALATDYAADAAAADDRYKGKYLIVEGVASGIRRDHAHVYLEIRTDNPGVVVRADLLKDQICGPGTRACEVEARATMVRRGQKVAVECNGAGVGKGGTPLLSDCLLRGGAN